jgi:hypothetical protein
MGCLLAIGALLAPRAAIFLVWLARPNLFDAAFGGIIVPLLGIAFLPYTTLVYVLVFTPGVGVAGSDWIWLVLAFVADIFHVTANVAEQRYTTGSRSF